MKKQIFDESNGLSYTLYGELDLPDLNFESEVRPIGYFGYMHREYLKQKHPARFQILLLKGELWNYLADLNEQAQERLDTIIGQMKADEGVTEELKAKNQLEWVQCVNNIRNRAEEIVKVEMIYV